MIIVEFWRSKFALMRELLYILLGTDEGDNGTLSYRLSHTTDRERYPMRIVSNTLKNIIAPFRFQ